MIPQDAAPPRYSFATSGPSTSDAPIQTVLPNGGRGDDRPEPGPRGELAPTLGELSPHARRLHALGALDPHRGEDCRADEVGRPVEPERPTRAGGGHEHSAERRAEDVRAVLRHPEQRVRLLEQARAHRLGDEPLRGREEEGHRDAPETWSTISCQSWAWWVRSSTRDPALGQSAQQVRSRPSQVARQPVGEDAAEEHEQKLGTQFAVRTRPRSVFDPVRSRTANASAIGATAVPSRETS